MIIDDQIRDIVGDIDSLIESQNSSKLIVDGEINKLITQLRQNCNKPENQGKYQAYSNIPGEVDSYPLDGHGFAKAIDPLVAEEEFYDHWARFGVVVNPNVVANTICNTTVARIHSLMLELSNQQCDLQRPETYDAIPKDKNGAPVLSRGFFEIYHDDSLAQLRQAIRVYIHHVVLWGTTELWTTFDRFGVKLPGHKESKGLPLHVDQNPSTNPHFKSVQGVLALADCPTERGTLLVVPGSKKYFLEYQRMKNRGEFVQLDTSDHIAELLTKYAQPMPLRSGSLVTWDSRTTHSNTENISDQTRMVAYIAAGRAREERTDLISARETAFSSGLASYNHDALMRVTQKPRFNDEQLITQLRKPEQLHLLGQLLYGKSSYQTI